MSDPLPPTTVEKTVVVDNRQYCRLWTFTLISIALNVVILATLLICGIMHHRNHHKHHGFGERGGCGDQGGRREFAGQRGGFGGGREFHHFRGMGVPGQGWGRAGGFDRGGQGPMDMRGGAGMGGEHNFGGGMGRGRDRMGGGFSGPGMMGGPNQTPDPAKMTDMILNQLTAKLTLTDDQKAKMKPIIQDQVRQMQKDMEARRAAMQKSMEDSKAKIRPFLNADQQKQLDAMQLPGEKPTTAPAPAAK